MCSSDLFPSHDSGGRFRCVGSVVAVRGQAVGLSLIGRLGQAVGRCGRLRGQCLVATGLVGLVAVCVGRGCASCRLVLLRQASWLLRWVSTHNAILQTANRGGCRV